LTLFRKRSKSLNHPILKMKTRKLAAKDKSILQINK